MTVRLDMILVIQMGMRLAITLRARLGLRSLKETGMTKVIPKAIGRAIQLGRTVVPTVTSSSKGDEL